MSDRIVQMILNEGNWLPVSMGLALLATSVLWCRSKRRGAGNRHLPAAALGLFAGVMIGVMAFGHFLAVTVKLLRGDLTGSIPLLYLIGMMLAVPAGWLVRRSVDHAIAEQQMNRLLVAPNAWLAATLLLMGQHNLPLALPALCGVAYQFQQGRVMGRVIIGFAVLTGAGLFVASLVFMASGQTFEEFTGRG